MYKYLIKFCKDKKSLNLNHEITYFKDCKEEAIGKPSFEKGENTDNADNQLFSPFSAMFSILLNRSFVA